MTNTAVVLSQNSKYKNSKIRTASKGRVLPPCQGTNIHTTSSEGLTSCGLPKKNWSADIQGSLENCNSQKVTMSSADDPMEIDLTSEVGEESAQYMSQAYFAGFKWNMSIFTVSNTTRYEYAPLWMQQSSFFGACLRRHVCCQDSRLWSVEFAYRVQLLLRFDEVGFVCALL